ncbi:hypothetical protein ASE48_16245 [Mycobacterium sp. Root265]|nr:hypothetical protein ASE48_16245 [Mycobacterium sp. Root265]
MVESTPSPAESATAPQPRSRVGRKFLTYGALAVLIVGAAGGLGYLRWQQWSLESSGSAAQSSFAAASEAAVAILSYQPDTVEQDLTEAESKLTGAFRDSYRSLTKDVVIPGARDKGVSAEASVPAAASVSATPNRAVVLVFVNQTLIVGDDPPTASTSSVRVTMDHVDGKWLVSGFDPV